MPDLPWYHDGLRFECTECGKCCTGEPGFVWLNAAEIRAMAQAVQLDKAAFEARYVREVRVKKSLIELANGDCIFFDPAAGQCTVYHARPRQCRTWPFWESTVCTPQDWDDTVSVCPGCGQGPIVPAEEILRQVAVVRV
jgi:Fe-S-cluster containining protein